MRYPPVASHDRQWGLRSQEHLSVFGPSAQTMELLDHVEQRRLLQPRRELRIGTTLDSKLESRHWFPLRSAQEGASRQGPIVDSIRALQVPNRMVGCIAGCPCQSPATL